MIEGEGSHSLLGCLILFPPRIAPGRRVGATRGLILECEFIDRLQGSSVLGGRAAPEEVGIGFDLPLCLWVALLETELESGLVRDCKVLVSPIALVLLNGGDISLVDGPGLFTYSLFPHRPPLSLGILLGLACMRGLGAVRLRLRMAGKPSYEHASHVNIDDGRWYGTS